MDLRRQIAEKERIVEILEREGCQLSVKQDRAVLEDSNSVAVARAKGDLNPGVQTRSFTIKDVKKTVPNRMKTPLDAILENIQEHDLGDALKTDSSWRRNLPEPVPLSTTFATNFGARKKEYPFGGVLSANPHVYSGSDPAELFLNPNSNKGKHALLILDFVSKVVPEQEENVISLGKNTRLSVTCDNRRPKLSEVSLSEFNIANTRILFRLIETGQLPTYSDLKDYLVYSVKINQLASKFSWRKVLKYDEEFWLAQAKYSFPWSYDSHHMHTVLLSGSPVSSNSPRPMGQNVKYSRSVSTLDFATETSNGQTVCKNFNRFSGCGLDKCDFGHVCNHRFSGHACLLPHPGFRHFSAVNTSQGPR